MVVLRHTPFAPYKWEVLRSGPLAQTTRPLAPLTMVLWMYRTSCTLCPHDPSLYGSHPSGADPTCCLNTREHRHVLGSA